MKTKLLAPTRRDHKPSGGQGKGASNKTGGKGGQQRGTSTQKSPMLQSEFENHDKNQIHKFEQKFRNKNLQVIPPQMLVTLSALTTLDISNNKLSDSQMELIMNSCGKLSTLCIQGNLNYLIPASINKLKLLINFRHDWVVLNPQDIYQSNQRLQKIKNTVKKTQLLSKSNRVNGIDFLVYAHSVLEIPIDKNLYNKIQNSDSSLHAKQNMLKLTDDLIKGRIALKQNQKYEEQTQAEQATNIKSQQQIRQPQQQVQQKIEPELVVNTNPSMPLHYLFANFDKNPQAAAQIDGLLLKGYNPNQQDENGLSAFHVCVLEGQKKGLEYLLDISSNNPGFFDLEITSLKDGWNILHLSVYLKNIQFTRLLIDFGLPTQKRDLAGCRLIHLAQKNYQFLIQLRKLLKKRSTMARSLTALTIPPIPPQNKKNYIKHPNRQRQESRFRITYSKNEKLLEMYEVAAGLSLKG